MYKIIAIVIIVILLLFGGAFAIKNYLGDVRPAFLPSNTPLKDLTDNPFNPQATESAVPQFKTKSLPFDLKVAGGFDVAVFANEIGKVRDLAFSPGGTLLASVPGEGRVIALAVGADGTVTKKIVIDELTGPHGLAFYNGKLFIAEENRLARYVWDESSLKAQEEKELMKLPAGSHDAHTIVFDRDGFLYTKIGSSCNVCTEKDAWRATVLKSDQDGKYQSFSSNEPAIFATGLRNAAFMTVHPETGEIWATENGRDQLGDDLPPEEINIVRQNNNYGWPKCYGNKIHDTSFDKDANDPCATTVAPAFEMQAHSAPLGLSFVPQSFSAELNGDLLVAFHGSWNRSEPTGYKVVRLNTENGQVKDQTDFLTGFIQGSNAAGRPVDVEFDKAGNLFVSDDKYGAIYVISAQK